MTPPSMPGVSAASAKRNTQLIQSNTAILLCAIVTGGIALFVFHRSIHVPFWMEDFLLIDLVNRKTFGQYILYTFSGEQYHLAFLFRPLSHYVYWKAGVMLFGLGAAGFHLISLLVHAGNAMLVTVLGARLFKSISAGVIAGAIYAVGRVNFDALYHLPHVQDLLVTFLALVAVLAYMDTREAPQRMVRSVWLALVAYVLALGSKESAVVIPVLLLLYELAFMLPSQTSLHRIMRSLLYNLWPFVAITLLYFGMRLPAMRYGLGSEDSGYKYVFELAMLNKYGWGAFWSLEALFEPLRAAKVAWLPDFHPLQNKPLAFGIMFVILIGAIWFVVLRTRTTHVGRGHLARGLIFGLGWFCVAPLPIIFIPAFAADLFITASVGLALAVGGLLAFIIELGGQRDPRQILATTILVLFVFISGHSLISRVESETEWLQYPYVAQQATNLMAQERDRLTSSSQVWLIGFSERVFPWSTGEAAVRVYTGMTLPTQKVSRQELTPNLACDDLVLLYDEKTTDVESYHQRHCSR